MDQQLWSIVIVFSGVISSGQIALSAENPQPISISAARFSQMSSADQKMLLIRVFERRLEHAKNLYYKVDTFSKNHEDLDGEVGKPLNDASSRRFQYEQWGLGNSYRIDTNKYRQPKLDELYVWMASGFDADQGVGRSTGRVKGKEKTYGRIDTKHNPAVGDNQYRYWLNGDYPRWQEYLFRYLLSRRGEFEIEAPVEGDKVRLTVGYQPSWAKESGGKRAFLLDPQEGFLPIRGDSRWDGSPGRDGRPQWRVEKFTVTQSKLVGDVWMPIEMRFAIACSAATVPGFTVYDMTVSKIEGGKVTPADLEVPFTEGMFVVDAIKGVSYKAGPDGQPRGTPELR